MTKPRLVPRHVHVLSYPKRGWPYICFHSSMRYKMLEHSNYWRAAGTSWECSVSLTHHPLCFSITYPHRRVARYHCRSRHSVYFRVYVLELKLHSGFVAKAVPQTYLWSLGDGISTVEPKAAGLPVNNKPWLHRLPGPTRFGQDLGIFAEMHY